MSFTKKQVELLSAPLDKARVAQRSQAGMNLSYLEGYDVMDTANAIFGYENWSYVISDLRETSLLETKDKYDKAQYRVSYIAIIKTSVIAGDKQIVREDVGYGSGISKQLGDAIESATKEAVTDGFKRAMRGFGNQFGNALYDKTQKNVKEYTAEEIIEQVQKQDPSARPTKIVDYKGAIKEVMIANNVKAEDVPNCAKYLITNGLDIAQDPRAVYTQEKEKLITYIKDYVEAAGAF